MSADEWPKASEPTAMDHIIASINYTTSLRRRHAQAGPSKGLFQTIPSHFQKGSSPMDTSDKHHSDILDTLSDYLTRPEVTKITLDRDEDWSVWSITATVEVDPAHEARKLEADMAEAVGLANDASGWAPLGRLKSEPITSAPNRSSTLIGTEFDEPSDPLDSVAVEFSDIDGETWGLCWDGKLRLLDDYPHLGPLDMSEVLEQFGPLMPKTQVSRAQVEAARRAGEGAPKDEEMEGHADPILKDLPHVGFPSGGGSPSANVPLKVVDRDGDTWLRTWGDKWRMKSAYGWDNYFAPFTWETLRTKYGPIHEITVITAEGMAQLRHAKTTKEPRRES